MTTIGKKLHFIGIGGIGVSAVARIAIERGHDVRGSDVRRSQLTDAMEALGARVFIGHDASNLDGADTVVLSTAIPEHNAELKAARETGMAIVHRSELLAHFLSDRLAIGVTGTHGKGTVSSMVTAILDADARDPGFIIGGLLLNYGVNARAGGGTYMVAEVDESDGTHANVPVDHLVINFLDADHLNYYRDHAAIIDSMVEVVNGSTRLKRAYVNLDCPGNQTFVGRCTRPLTTYALDNPAAQWRAEIVGRGQLPLHFRVFHNGGPWGGDFTLPLPGRYNVLNALAAISVCAELGVGPDAAARGLSTFKGLENRFTIEDAAGVTVVKDYNSHPTAIRKVLESARDMTTGRMVSVFKPYRYTLTHYLRDEYPIAFADSDEVIITTMYAANEDPIPGVDTEFVVNMLRGAGLTVTLIPDQTKIVEYIDSTVNDGDSVLFFGGDDFFRMADAWTAQRRNMSAVQP
jgi:UDP-N-acetylmuramate--alanine ligase